ncbi:CDP-glycerol glycerophosphotransferase family protein [Amedibacillus sp. YH-ame10]
MERFINKLRLVKIKDVFSLFLFLVALPCSIVKKHFDKEIWLICESEKEARDNGYWFYRYLCEQHPEINAVYAINKHSVDYERIKNMGRVISFGTFQHWIYYLSAKYNISSQKDGKPNAAACYLLEVYGVLKNTRIFLQHGITISKATWLFYENTKMRLFVCGAKPEFEAIKRDFHYPDDHVALLGFCRFDALYDRKTKKGQILVMPSWREWLNSNTVARKELEYDGDFLHSKYYKYWNEFLESERLKNILDANNLELVFYPHRNMQQYLNSFKPKSERIVLGDWTKYDVQTLLKESALLITDYSSVFMDFSYMYKPIQYYQFDVEDFRKGQYAEGYFSYVNDGFGEVSFDLTNLLDVLEGKCNNDMKLEDIYKQRIDSFFTVHDTSNCERTYKAIRGLDDGHE